MSTPLNIARWLERSAVNGPGERFVLWLQGCPLRCPGCWNPDTWDFAPQQLLEPEDLVALVRQVPGIEGVTLTGGEPFAQSESLAPAVRELRQMGLSIMVFTGYEMTELTSPSAGELLQMTDIVVTGRYRENVRTEALAWRGSANQEVVFVTDRYSESDLRLGAKMRVEAHIGPGGEVVLTGFPELGLVGDAWPTAPDPTTSRHRGLNRPVTGAE